MPLYIDIATLWYTHSTGIVKRILVHNEDLLYRTTEGGHRGGGDVYMHLLSTCYLTTLMRVANGFSGPLYRSTEQMITGGP